ncbi:MAG: methionine aminotransferase [Bacteroidota bacterium]
MNFTSKLPSSETTIFTVMSTLAKEHNAINLGQGFPDFDNSPLLRELVSKHLNAGKNQYCPMPGSLELRAAISAKLNKSYGIKVDPDTEICITAGATQGLFTTIMAFVDKGEEVILFEPAFDSYAPAIQIAGGIPKPYVLPYPTYQVDWNQVEAMITDKTRMIMINTPHNPTGTVLSTEDLQALEQLVSGKDIIVLSDEVYEHLIYDGLAHQSALTYPALFQQCISVFSFGKTFHSTGWKIGYCVGPAPLMQEFKNIHQWNVFSVNSFTQYALAEYLQVPAHYEELPGFYQQKRDYLNQALEATPLQPLLSKGTFFQLFGYEGLSELSDAEFAKYLTREIGVAAIPLSPFYTQAPDQKVIRLCFAKKEETMDQAAERLEKLGQ